MYKSVLTILQWQGELKVDLITQGLTSTIADGIAANYIQKLIDSDILDKEVKKELQEFVISSKV